MKRKSLNWYILNHDKHVNFTSRCLWQYFAMDNSPIVCSNSLTRQCDSDNKGGEWILSDEHGDRLLHH